jgi:hypothetical protein
MLWRRSIISISVPPTWTTRTLGRDAAGSERLNLTIDGFDQSLSRLEPPHDIALTKLKHPCENVDEGGDWVMVEITPPAGLDGEDQGGDLRATLSKADIFPIIWSDGRLPRTN